MNIKFYYLVVFILIGVNIRAGAQVAFNKKAIGSIGVSPKEGNFLNGASLDNVDMMTGTLKLGIPLYEIKVNDISVPIMLNYSATGLKVGQEAGAPGMGWELSAGGKIITNVQGMPDYLDSKGIQYNPLPNVPSLNPYTDLAHKQLVGKLLDGKIDGAWDTYNYILPNGGGTFTKNGLTFPYDPLVQIQFPGAIKTSDGLIYQFGTGDKRKTTKRQVYDSDVVMPTVKSTGTQWTADPGFTSDDSDLDRIISTKFQDTVKFGYDIFSMITHAPKLQAKTRITTSEMIPLYRDIRARTTDQMGVANDALDQKYKIQEPIVSQNKSEYLQHTRIKNIDFKNGRVVFQYRADDILGRDVLLHVRIYQKIGNDTTLIKRYYFEYDENDQQYGHYLIALHIYDGKNVHQGAYSFNYNDRLRLVPNTENMAQDRWGFYNGIATNKTLIENPDSILALRTRAHYPIINDGYPSSDKLILYTRPEAKQFYGTNLPTWSSTLGTYVCNINFANRRFSFAYATKGVLTSVKTPTGGTFEYEYEPHRIRYRHRVDQYNANWQQRDGGGIRIKSITKRLGHETSYYGYNESEKNFRKKYAYGIGKYMESESPDETSGYGIVTIPGNVTSNISMYYDNGSLGNIPVYNMQLLSHPINNMVQYGGSYGMYPSVTEYLMKNDYSEATYGKTVYYNNPVGEGSRPDAPWQENGATLEYNALPVMTINPGVTKENGVSPGGVKKYKYKSNGTYQAVEETKYSYKTIWAPQNSTNKLISFFGATTGQFFGVFPEAYSLPVAKDFPTYREVAGQAAYLFNATNTSGDGGVMNYMTVTNIIQEEGTMNYYGKYQTVLEDLNAYSNCQKKEREQTTVFTDAGLTGIMTDTRYYYDNEAHLLPTRTATYNSKGDSTYNRIKYAQDFPANNPGNVIDYMKVNKIGLSEPIQEFTSYKRGAGPNNEYIKSGALYTYRLENGLVYSDKVFKYKANSDVENIDNNTQFFNGGESTIDTNKFKLQVSYDLYIKGNVHKYTEAGGSGNVIFWGYGNQYPIAKVNNASNMSVYNTTTGRYSSADVAYTSFENKDTCNWVYSGSPVAEANSPSGKKVYSLSSGAITKLNYTPSGKYIISYWYKNGATVNVSGGTVGAAVIKNSYGDWLLAEREISAISGTVTVSGTGTIDELRFHPTDSQMTTYVYDPLVGLTCSLDSRGNAVYYEYDASQRLQHIRDQKGNIVKSYKYIMGSLN